MMDRHDADSNESWLNYQGGTLSYRGSHDGPRTQSDE